MPTTYSGLVAHIIGIINLMIPALFAVVFIYLVWKVIDAWIIHAGEDKSREEGRRYVIAAVIAFVVMISAWGIVALIKKSFFG
jgi:TRAP-type mannitol/chloroaromatic compound transport system permease small subunit